MDEDKLIDEMCDKYRERITSKYMADHADRRECLKDILKEALERQRQGCADAFLKVGFPKYHISGDDIDDLACAILSAPPVTERE